MSALLADVTIGSEALKMKVYSHTLPSASGAVASLTFVTEGLRRLGQREMVMTLRDRVGARDALIEEVGQIMALYPMLAAEGRTTRAGTLTTFGRHRPFGCHLAYAPAMAFEDVAIDPEMLRVLLVNDDDREGFARFGMTRWMSRKGRETQWFPVAAWCESEGPRAYFSDDGQHSILKGVAALGLEGAVTLRGATVHFTPHGRDHEALADACGEARAARYLAVLPQLDPEADACMVWSPGQSQREAISRLESRGEAVGLCFLLCMEAPETKLTFLEDGVAVGLESTQFEAFIDALSAGEGFTLRTPEGGFSLDAVRPLSALFAH